MFTTYINLNDVFVGLWRICSQVGEEWKCFASQEHDIAVIFTKFFIIFAVLSFSIAAVLNLLIAIRKSYPFFEFNISIVFLHIIQVREYSYECVQIIALLPQKPGVTAL